MKVGLVGAGTVGGGVCEILRLRAEQLPALEVTKICVRDAAKKRDFEVPAGCEIVTDVNAIINDDSIEMVIELMGGVTVAKDVVMGALVKGKHVVTGNKALIAAHLPEIQAAAKAGNAAFGYEAAVCGSIPIIAAMRRDYVGDTITAVMGIMNGTTNFILSKMESEGADYSDVLAEAQQLGYAETPPDFDVEGWDARSKLAILCKLAFGVFVPELNIPCAGITRIAAVDFEYAKQLQSTVKILGVASRNEDGSISAHVSTMVVPFSSPLSRVTGPMNCIEVTSQNCAQMCFSGPGAGRYPTANSVVNDVAMIGSGGGRGDPFPMNSAAQVKSEVSGRFYIRFTICDGLGIIRTIGEKAEKAGISIHSILQTPIVNPQKVMFVLTTERTTLTAVKQMCDEVAKLSWNKDEALIMPIMD